MTVRVPSVQYEALQQGALEQKTSVSGYCRSLVERALSRIERDVDAEVPNAEAGRPIYVSERLYGIIEGLSKFKNQTHSQVLADLFRRMEPLELNTDWGGLGTTITFRMPEYAYKRLKDIAEKRHVTISSVMREAVSRLLLSALNMGVYASSDKEPEDTDEEWMEW